MAEKVVWEYGKPKESPKKAPLDTPIMLMKKLLV